jgi:methylated-DNA-[protein]-cysteine S-methyltransferase
MESWLNNEAPDDVGQALEDLLLDGPDQETTRHAVHALRQRLSSTKGEVAYIGGLSDPTVGSLMVARTARGLVAVAFTDREGEFINKLEKEGFQVAESPSQVDQETRQLSEYLDAKRSSFDLQVDLSSLTAFQREVLMAVSEVPPGEVITYQELAQRIGRPNAARAVGQALGRNPVPIVIPCHRVIASDGSLGGYSGAGGIATKAALLQLEGAPV